MSRKPARERYDALVGLEPRTPGEAPRFAFALVKLTFEMGEREAKPAAPDPLELDVYGDETLEPRFPPGSDYWLDKTATDVVVRGSAHQLGGRPAPTMLVSVSVGRAVKRIAVFGKREIVWRGGGRVEIPAPEPFAEMALGYQNAYGGMDPRVPVPEPQRETFERLAKAGLATDHPGLYPRNPMGKGYLVYPEPIAGLPMPNLEDPEDLLTAERLVVGSPELWYRQPLPWCFDFTNGLMYPRELHAGFDAWFPCRDDDALSEVRRGFLPRGLAGTTRPRRFAPEYFQEASLGMVFPAPLAGLPVTLSGMDPELATMTFAVPPDPSVVIEVAGEKTPVLPRLTNLFVRPADKKFVAVYCAKTEALSRTFLPGIHKDIPLSVSVNGDRPIPYDCPTPIRERLEAAQAKAGSGA